MAPACCCLGGIHFRRWFVVLARTAVSPGDSYVAMATVPCSISLFGFCLVELRMPRTGGTPRNVPYGADQTIYLVIDRFSGLGSVCRETEAEGADLETIIADLMSGQFNDPIRVVAFNTLEHWSDDVSEETITAKSRTDGRLDLARDQFSAFWTAVPWVSLRRRVLRRLEGIKQQRVIYDAQ